MSNNYRSGLEQKVAKQLEANCIAFQYEARKIAFEQPVKQRSYTPDFILPNGIVIETKGIFDVEDRQKHLWVREQHPELDIRFVFSSSKTKLRKGSPTSYGEWCEKNGFLYADKAIPAAWLV
ncbi:hypothetical protein QTI05_24195 [Variovorax sp. J22R193]|uniref:hypothetical protein n=1 Tax=Variovorax fucosicus TaxID=3053517 RepID=UPI0025767812|nr:hypothetical protein [Variovorax sp. J22R193]MDM0042161.1 hypothetical protein [Variovorax sp. J22R193]